MDKISSLYLHFPFCKHLCNYCDFYKHKLLDEEQILDFNKLLDQQFEYHEKYLSTNNLKLENLETLYLGGGTPSLWGSQGAEVLVNLLDKYKINLNLGCEMTLEVDPDTWSEESLHAWKKAGVNRFSIGSQAFHNKFIRIMDRSHNLGQVEKTLKYLSDIHANFSVDLMLGLPKSEDRNLAKELDKILEYNPNHLSLYILKTRKNYPLNAQLPSDDIIHDEYLFVSKYLRSNGFRHYEVSNFAKPGFESKHNLKYWNYKSVVGIGPNATGLLVYKNKAIRYQWKSQSIGLTEESISGESLLIEKLFLGIRYNGQFNLAKLFSYQSNEALNKCVSMWKKRKYISDNSHVENIRTLPLGYLMSDSMVDDVFREVEF